jgi:hypothetical protein
MKNFLSMLLVFDQYDFELSKNDFLSEILVINSGAAKKEEIKLELWKCFLPQSVTPSISSTPCSHYRDLYGKFA